MRLNSEWFFPIIILCLMGVTMFYGYLSILIWGLLWYALGHSIISVSNIKQFGARQLFDCFFLIYLLYSFVTDISYVTNPFADFFYAKDSLHFFAHADNLGRQRSLEEIIAISLNDFICADWKGFSIIIGIVSYISNVIDNNNIFVQKLIIVFFSSLIVPFLFSILSLFSKHAFKYALIYGLFSYSLFYSAVLLRDVIVGFLYVAIFLAFFKQKSLRVFFVLLFLSLICFLFRPEHGYFSLVFVCVYAFLLMTDSNKKGIALPILAVTMILLFISGGVIFSAVEKLRSTATVTEEYSLEGASSSSLGVALLGLPWGVKHIAAGLFSQVLPFPFYAGLEKGFAFITLSIASLFWYFNWVFILLSRPFQTFKHLDRNLKYLMLVSLVLILLASTNADTRRIMCVYPVVYVVSVIGFEKLSRLNRVRVFIFGVLVYLVLLLIYLIIK